MSAENWFEKDLQKAVAWAATEHNFFVELKEDLAYLTKQIRSAASLDDSIGIKKVYHGVRYLGKSERRLDNYLKKVKSLFLEMNAKINISRKEKEKKRVIERLDIEAGHLMLDVSRHQGKIIKLFKELEKFLNMGHAGKALEIITEIKEVVDDAEKWLAALSSDLSEAKKVEEEFGNVYWCNTIDQLEAQLKELSDQELKIDYLTHLLMNEKKLRREVAKNAIEILNLLGGTKKAADFLKDAGYFYFTGELYELSAKESELKYGEKKSRELEAAQIYRDLGKHELAIKIYVKYRMNSDYIMKHSGDLGGPKKLAEYFEREIGYPGTSPGYFRRVVRAVKYHFLAGNLTKGNSHLKTILNDENFYFYYHFKWEFWKGKINQLTLINTIRLSGKSKLEAWKFVGDHLYLGIDKAEAYEKAKRFDLAAKIWKTLGIPIRQKKAEKKALKLTKKLPSKDKMKAAQILFERGEYDRAGKIYEELGMYDKAAEVYRESKSGLKLKKALDKSKGGRVSLAKASGDLSLADEDKSGGLSQPKKRRRKARQ
jgi:hypothetical protein